MLLDMRCCKGKPFKQWPSEMPTWFTILAMSVPTQVNLWGLLVCAHTLWTFPNLCVWHTPELWFWFFLSGVSGYVLLSLWDNYFLIFICLHIGFSHFMGEHIKKAEQAQHSLFSWRFNSANVHLLFLHQRSLLPYRVLSQVLVFLTICWAD